MDDPVLDTLYPVWGTCLLSQWSGRAVRFVSRRGFLMDFNMRLFKTWRWNIQKNVLYSIWHAVPHSGCLDISRRDKPGSSFHNPLCPKLCVCLHHIWGEERKHCVISLIFKKRTKGGSHEAWLPLKLREYDWEPAVKSTTSLGLSKNFCSSLELSMSVCLCPPSCHTRINKHVFIYTL